MSLFAELQRRSVFKVGAAYLVVGWLLVQVATSVLPQYDTPAWFLRAFILVLALGLPVALLLAWAFEVTPEGVRYDAGGAGTKRIVLIAALLGVASMWWFLRGTGDGSPGADVRSIAVLPFVNMSGDPQNEYFSDGVSEEILNSLAQVPDLKVAARTSSFSFKGKDAEVPAIAKALEVRMVLEGSVRRQGDRVRITAQLIDASSGFHVWSQTYDRELEDIFAIQAEIARAIARELKLKLGGAAQRETVSTDPETYDLYLKGLALWQQRGEPGLRQAERFFRQATERDPSFAKGWAGLALTYAVLPDYTSDDRRIAEQHALEAAEIALALEPTLPEPYAVIAGMRFTDEPSAMGERAEDALFARAKELAPSYATAYQWHSESLGRRGEFERSVEVSRQAYELDPLAPTPRLAYASALGLAGHEREAIAMLRELIAEKPQLRPAIANLQAFAALSGDSDALRYSLLAGARDRSPDTLAFIEALVAGLTPGRVLPKEVAARLAEMPLLGSPVFVSVQLRYHLFLAAGRKAQAMDALDRIAVWGRGPVRRWAELPVSDLVRCEPRFQAQLDRIGIEDPRRAQVCGASGKGG